MIERNNQELALEDAYQDWQELLYLNGDQDQIDKLEKKYYTIFEEVSNVSDHYSPTEARYLL